MFSTYQNFFFNYIANAAMLPLFFCVFCMYLCRSTFAYFSRSTTYRHSFISYTTHAFLANHVHVRYMLSPVRLSSVCRLSDVCNVRAPYSGGSNFRQYFYGVRYHGHPLIPTENLTEIVPGEPLRRGS